MGAHFFGLDISIRVADGLFTRDDLSVFGIRFNSDGRVSRFRRHRAVMLAFRPSPARLGVQRIRRKLFALHTFFSIVLAMVLLLALRPAVRSVVMSAAEQTSRAVIEMARTSPIPPMPGKRTIEGVILSIGAQSEVGLTDDEAVLVRAQFAPRVISSGRAAPVVAAWNETAGVYMLATGRADHARRAMLRLYAMVVMALLAVYVLIALALEVFILPKNVWRPIARLREADAAVQGSRREEELIPEEDMPRDELGEIMRSRNESIRKLREHEHALAQALEQLESVANDLKRKNHLLESVSRNLDDQDRLLSLGMMSAGLAHEMNTPLAVLKGAIEEIVEKPGKGVEPVRAALLARIVHRLERLSESLLDFARVHPHTVAPVVLRDVIEEAWELVRLDRETAWVEFVNTTPQECVIAGDADRLGQVFVNILRNAADVVEGAGRISVSAARAIRDGAEWISIHIIDSGPGVPPELLPRLFEPFTTTRLDAHGTGLGLAVAEGIVREHGGVILATNAPAGGADFEIMLPVRAVVRPSSSEGVS